MPLTPMDVPIGMRGLRSWISLLTITCMFLKHEPSLISRKAKRLLPCSRPVRTQPPMQIVWPAMLAPPSAAPSSVETSTRPGRFDAE